MKFLKANSIAQDWTPHFAASHLGLFCLPMSHKKDVRLIWVKIDSSFLNYVNVLSDRLKQNNMYFYYINAKKPPWITFKI